MKQCSAQANIQALLSKHLSIIKRMDSSAKRLSLHASQRPTEMIFNHPSGELSTVIHQILAKGREQDRGSRGEGLTTNSPTILDTVLAGQKTI
jgi:hypothetical protein